MSSKRIFKWSGEKDISEVSIPYGYTEIGDVAF